MPLYDYHCAGCGERFSQLRPMARCSEPAACPGCGQEAPRQISAPRLSTLRADLRRAHETNERSQHAPRSSRGHVCGAGCNHGGETKLQSAAAGKRPWMLGH